MNDLISRTSVIEIIQNMYPGMPSVPWLRKEWQERYEPYIRVEKTIRKLPSAQPERKIGEWIIKDDTERFIAQCNRCGYIEDSRLIKNTCPKCGADMRGKRND